MTGIRGLAACWVLMEHFWYETVALVPESDFLTKYVLSGFLSIELFFVLSGFIISYNYADEFRRITKGAYRKFIVNRLARVYPVHFVTLWAALVLIVGAGVLNIEINEVHRTPLTFIWNLLLLHGIFYVPAFNSPAWSVSVEFAAYVVFPVIAAVGLSRVHSAKGGFMTSAFFSLAGTAGLVAIGHWVNPVSTGQGMFWVRITSEFLCGCFMWAGWSRLKSQEGRWGDALIWGSIVVTFIALTLIDAETVFVPEVFILTPVMALFVLGCATANGSGMRFMSNRVLMWTGKTSYSMYLTHFLILIVGVKIIDFRDYTDRNLGLRLGMLVVYYGLTYIVAGLTYHILEEPGRKFVRRRFLREGPDIVERAASGDASAT